MAPNHFPVADTSPAPFHARSEDRLSENILGNGLRENARFGWDQRVSRATADRDDRCRVGYEVLMVSGVNIFYSVIETGRWEGVWS